MIPPREQLPKSWKSLKNYTFDLPRLSPDSPFTCPITMPDIMEYLGVEAPGGLESGSENVMAFDLKFVRTALVNNSRYWIWTFIADEGVESYVAVELRADGTKILGYDESFELMPEQWLVMDYYGEYDWENEE